MSHATTMVGFDDTTQNWQLWGQLVEMWALRLHPTPDTAAKLVAQMSAHGIQGAYVDGPPGRPVKFHYRANDEVLLVLPTPEMLRVGRQEVKPNEAYPLPVYYDAFYTGTRKKMSDDELTLAAACRLGEFTINGEK